MNMAPMNQAGMFLMNLASGTSAKPASWPMPMVSDQKGPARFAAQRMTVTGMVDQKTKTIKVERMTSAE